jgi:hypothetical protein
VSALPLKFLCPHCESLLRMLREQVAVQPRFNCPSCHQLVLVTVDGAGGIEATRGDVAAATTEHSAEKEAARDASASEAASANKLEAGPGPLQEALRQPPERHVATRDPVGRMANLVRRARGSQKERSVGVPWYLSPTLIAWSMAGVCGSALLGFALWYDTWPTSHSSATPPDSTPPAAAAPVKTPEDRGVASKVPPKAETPVFVKPPPGDNPRDRLVSLGIAIKHQRDVEGLFPSGTWPLPGFPAEQRFSWLARLLHTQAWQPTVPVVWERPWNDPLNDSFVRRRIPDLQNPSVSQLTGADRYPATHFVGVAGVGADAARLTTDDPRAGIFGDDRRVKFGDIKGGASNTLLMAGVQDQLGSWASGGTATVRGFTREPYINGPDGFGTGQARSMLVLMADGSVRELSVDTAPHVIRQMATISDDQKQPAPPEVTKPPPIPVAVKTPDPDNGGLPPAPVPGAQPVPVDPKDGEQPDPKVPVRRPRIIVEPVGPPGAKVEPKPAPPAIPVVKNKDPQVALAVKIAGYRRSEAVPLATVLDEIAEMSGVDIVCEPGVLGPDGMLQLNKNVRVNLEGTTIAGILNAVLQQVELKYKLERGQVHVIPAKTPR